MSGPKNEDKTKKKLHALYKHADDIININIDL